MLGLHSCLLAPPLEGLTSALLQRPAQRDRRRVWPVECGADHQVVRWQHAPLEAAEAALELVDAVELLARLEYVRDRAPIIVVGGEPLRPTHTLPLKQIVGAQLTVLGDAR